MKNNNLIYLDTYVLQQDMRIRMPKSILENMDLKKGKSKFKIYYDKTNSQLVLRNDEKSEKALED
jgi:hypothetical protein